MSHVALKISGIEDWAIREQESIANSIRQCLENIFDFVDVAYENKVSFLSLDIFRSIDYEKFDSSVQIDIYKILINYFEDAFFNIAVENKFKVRFLGQISTLPIELLNVISKLSAITINNKNMCISFALNYNSLAEMESYFNELLKQRFISSDYTPIRKVELDQLFYSTNLPLIDKIIYVNKENKNEDFLPYHAKNSTVFFSTDFFQDMSRADFYKLIGDNNE